MTHRCPDDPHDGLSTATLKDAGKIDIVLNRSGSPELVDCTVVRVDRDALLVAARTRPKQGSHDPNAAAHETLLIPTHAISHIKFKSSRAITRDHQEEH